MCTAKNVNYVSNSCYVNYFYWVLWFTSFVALIDRLKDNRPSVILCFFSYAYHGMSHEKHGILRI